MHDVATKVVKSVSPPALLHPLSLACVSFVLKMMCHSKTKAGGEHRSRVLLYLLLTYRVQCAPRKPQQYATVLVNV